MAVATPIGEPPPPNERGTWQSLTSLSISTQSQITNVTVDSDYQQGMRWQIEGTGTPPVQYAPQATNHTNGIFNGSQFTWNDAAGMQIMPILAELSDELKDKLTLMALPDECYSDTIERLLGLLAFLVDEVDSYRTGGIPI
jgi:hypothetical protein